MPAILCATRQNLRLLLRAIATFFRLDLPVALEWFKLPELFPPDPSHDHNVEAVRLCAR
jgi:hypothetical protein